jgi:hypothetical protein
MKNMQAQTAAAGTVAATHFRSHAFNVLPIYAFLHKIMICIKVMSIKLPSI